MLRVNPPADELGRVNAIVGGRARRYGVRGFAAPLSVKSVIRGTAAWMTNAGRFDLGPSGCLIVNDGEEYSLEIDALQPVETFCIFFRRGFVEEAHRSATTSSAALLDGDGAAPQIEFAERLQYDGGLRAAVESVRGDAGDASIVAVAERLVALHGDVETRIARLPALRASTRAEVRRRLHRAVESIHGNLAGDLSLERVASDACLAPFHFHRLFKSYFGDTLHRYVTRLRLERAAALLAGSDRPVTDVVLDCGFESASSFTSLFARHFGVPPSQFRKNREAAD